MAKSDNKVISLEDLHKLSAKAMPRYIKLLIKFYVIGVIFGLIGIALKGVQLWLN
jgi:hypothetical protein